MSYTKTIRNLKPPKGYRFLKIGEYIPVRSAKVKAFGDKWESVADITEVFGPMGDSRVKRYHNPFAVPIKT